MFRASLALLACLWLTPALAADLDTNSETSTQAAPAAALPDSKQIEQDLQHLPWPSFKSVIEGIPKLKADVDAYGEFGWNYVKANYTKYGWKKAIDKLDAEQKQHLVDLMRLTAGSM